MSKVRLYGSTSGYIELAAPAVADDSTLTLPSAAQGFGKVLQVVETVKTDTFSTTSATWVDVTGMSATITPTSSTSKVLVIAHLNYSRNVNEGSQGVIYLRLTGGGTENYVGDTSPGVVAQAHGRSTSIASFYSWSNIFSATPVYLASPATTSPVEVKLQMQGSATCYLNQPAVGAYGYTASSITLMEIAA